MKGVDKNIVLLFLQMDDDDYPPTPFVVSYQPN